MSSLYVHIPYCEARCGYCDFNAYGGRRTEHGPYMDALARDLEEAAAVGPERPLRTLFVGGGTPSVVPGSAVARIIELARSRFGFAPDVEISVEANPGSLDAPFLEALLAAGLTRVSLGVQSFHDPELRVMGRVHSSATALEAVAMARRCGVASLGLDLIFGLPGQTVQAWRENVEVAVSLAPDHLSMYGLTLEPGTPFGQAHEQGRLQVPDDDAQAEMQETALEVARRAGLRQYEISNYARPGHECRHNLAYWANASYLGVGAGAVTYLGAWRWTRVRRPDEYIRRVQAGVSLFAEGERVDGRTSLVETVFLGLRTVRGVDLDEVAVRHASVLAPGLSLRDMVRDLVEDLEEAGLCRFDGGRMSLTDAGRMVSNGVMERILELAPSLDKASGGW